MKDIIIKHKGLIRSIVRKFTRTYDEDIEQEIYIKAWQNLDKYKEEGKFASWIGTLAANVCLDYFKTKEYRAKQRQVDDEDILGSVSVDSKQEEEIDGKRRQKMILDAINSLPSQMSKVVILYEFEDKSYDEIAKKLGISEGTVKSRLFNARKILSEKLKFLKGE